MPYTVPEEFHRAARQATRAVTSVEWRRGGSGWQRLPWIDGTVKCSRRSNTRWSGSLVIPTGLDFGPDQINAYGTQVRIRRGFVLPRLGPVLVPWGVYRVRELGRSKSRATLDLQGLEQQVIEDRFLNTRRIGGDGVSAEEWIRTLVTEAVPGAQFQFSATNRDETFAAIIEPKDRWGVIDTGVNGKSICSTIGAEGYFDGAGIFVVEDLPTVFDTPDLDWTDTGVVINPVATGDRDQTYNMVRVVSETIDGKTKLGPVYAWDRNPNSPTYPGPNPLALQVASYEVAPFGRRIRYFSSSFFSKLDQLYRTANNLMVDSLGAQTTLSFDVLTDPSVVAGDVVAIDGQNYIIDEWQSNLRSGRMACDTRESKGEQDDITVQEAA